MTADATFWNDIAEEYAAKPVDLPEAFERKIAVTEGLLRPDSEVVELGCGTGTLAMRLASRAGRIRCLDISPEMLAFGRQKALDQGVGNVEFFEGAFDEAQPFEAGSADVVLAYSLFHLLEDVPGGLARAFSLLRPGGVLVSSTVCIGEGWVPYGLVLPLMRWLGKAPYVGVLTRRDFLAMVEEAGFVELEQPEVGAKERTVFLVARRPGA